MQKIIYTDYRGDKSLCGFVEEVQWKTTKWTSPTQDKEYVVSNGNGSTYTLEYVNCGKILFESLIEGYTRKISWEDSEEEFTDSELIQLCRMRGVWYESFEYDECEQCLVIHRGKPKYFLETDPKGPVDLEVDCYEELVNELINSKYTY